MLHDKVRRSFCRPLLTLLSLSSRSTRRTRSCVCATADLADFADRHAQGVIARAASVVLFILSSLCPRSLCIRVNARTQQPPRNRRQFTTTSWLRCSRSLFARGLSVHPRLLPCARTAASNLETRRPTSVRRRPVSLSRRPPCSASTSPQPSRQPRPRPPLSRRCVESWRIGFPRTRSNGALRVFIVSGPLLRSNADAARVVG